MENCKKCGAIISPGFIYCGKCGAPVNPQTQSGTVIKTKKIKAFKKAGMIIRNSPATNIILSVISSIIFILSLLYIVKLIYAIKASAPALDIYIEQFNLKYGFVREGLSLSYVGTELKYIITYILDWLYIALSGTVAGFSVFNIICCTLRVICLSKNKNTAIRPVRLNRIQTAVFRIFLYIVCAFIILFITAGIFMACI